MTKILMSVENPKGHKLEELLATVVSDLKFKNKKLTEDSPLDRNILANNQAIIKMLSGAVNLQNETMRLITAELGEDQGVSNPRIK